MAYKGEKGGYLSFDIKSRANNFQSLQNVEIFKKGEIFFLEFFKPKQFLKSYEGAQLRAIGHFFTFVP